MKVDILVLNYNGKDLMGAYLPSVCEAAKRSSHECKVYVIDNQSRDGSVEFLKKNFGSVGVILAEENKVLCSYNEALKALDSDAVILLNNDLKLREDFVDRIVGHFDEKDVFFAAPRILNFDGSYNGGRSYLRFEFGILKNEVDGENSEFPGDTHSIATGAFRRVDFLELGGFDTLYLPGIWEEVDLCYSALLAGKKGVYEPRAVMWHQESATFNRVYGDAGRRRIARRNMFLFVWKNIRDRRLIAEHIFFLPLIILYSIFSGRLEIAQGFALALRRLPMALSRRRANGRWQIKKITDRDVIRR